MSDKYQLQNNRGNFFTENNVTVPRKGKCKINNKEYYGSILKYSGQQDKYEFCISLGLLHFNSPDKKKSEGTPDIGGKITLPEVDLGSIEKAINDIKEGQSISEIQSNLKKSLSEVNTERVYKLGGWQNVSDKGTSYTNIKLSPEESVQEPKNLSNSSNDEDIPF